MIYDPERTKSIVNRLVLLGNNLRTFTIVWCAIQFAALLGILGALVSSNIWWLFALIGGLAGVVAGMFLSAALAVLLEWMAQLLIK